MAAQWRHIAQPSVRFDLLTFGCLCPGKCSVITPISIFLRHHLLSQESA